MDESMTMSSDHDHSEHTSELGSMSEAMDHSVSGHGSVFTVGDQEDITFLFSGWDLSDNGAYIGALLFTICLAVFFEWLNTMSRHLDLKLAQQHTCNVGYYNDEEATAPPFGAVNGESKDTEGNAAAAVKEGAAAATAVQVGDTLFTPGQQALRSSLAAFRTLVSLVLMLIFMYFDVGLCICVVAGALVGHFAFARDIDGAILGGVTEQHCRA